MDDFFTSPVYPIVFKTLTFEKSAIVPKQICFDLLQRNIAKFYRCQS